MTALRHYEIVVLIHPDQSEQVPAMVERYRAVIAKDGGHVHRFEDWGRRPLAYSIEKVHKAHYILMNIECGKDALAALKDLFRYNDAILRYLCLVREEAVTEMSPMMRGDESRRDEVELDFSESREE